MFEWGSNIISDTMGNEEVHLLHAKNKAGVLEARNYVHGQPFLVGKYFEECNYSCRTLHKYCMDQMSQGHGVLLVHYDRYHFRHDPGSISVGFEDLYHLFNFNVLDATLVKCLIL